MTTEHTYAATVVAPTCTEGGYTLHECSCGDSYQDTETAALGHDYTSSGEGTLTCTRCGDTIAHTHSYTVTVVPPTCTTGGYTLHECSCGDSYQDAATPALGHNFRNDPTTGGQKCRRCGYIEIPIEIPTSHGELMSLEEPTEPDALMLNEPENESDDGNSGQALHRGTATEITTDHSYIYAGGKLLRETITEGSTTKTLDFTYDNVGMPYSLIYNNGTTTATYYYITNLQGDVMYLVDASGNEVAAYDYDPYGKILSATGSMAEVNPLRYRGYYYDSETGFYYLQSRYYDPEICRFINADSYASTGQGFIGYNMFAYCLNNPINCSDNSGNWSISSIFTTVAIVALVVAVAALTVVSYGAASPALVAVAGGVLSGVSASTMATASTVAVVAVTTAAAAESTALVTQKIEKKHKETYSVYFLKDSHGVIKYVGRVTDRGFDQRMKYHEKTRGLTLERRISGLTYSEARGLEEIGMIECHTINRANPQNNQIHGISPNSKRGTTYIRAACEYLFNRAENKVLNMLF